MVLVNGIVMLDASDRIGSVDEPSPTSTVPPESPFVAPGTRISFPAHYNANAPASERPQDIGFDYRFHSLSGMNWTA
jgi:hypothetical protein